MIGGFVLARQRNRAKTGVLGQLAYCAAEAFFRPVNPAGEFWLSLDRFPEDHTEGQEAVFTPQWFRYDGYKRMVVPAMFWKPRSSESIDLDPDLLTDYARVANRFQKATRYNLGCGRDYRSGYVNCDLCETVNAERHFDLNDTPWPLDADSAEEVLLDNVLEHLKDVPGTMDEIWRVLKPSGVAHIIVPYAKSDWALQDVTHRHFFTEQSLNPFLVGCEARDHKGNPAADFYSRRKFILLKAELFTAGHSLRHRLRDLIPFRQQLRYFAFNLYDGVRFELRKPEP